MGPSKASGSIAVTASLLSLVLTAGSATASEFALFIVAGGTNALGRGTNVTDLPQEFQSPQNDVLFWYEEGSVASVQNSAMRIRSNGFVPLQYQIDTTGTTFGGPMAGFGAELSLGRQLADMVYGYQVGPDSIAILKFAFDSTSLAVDWHPDSTGSLFEQLMGQINLAITEIESRGHTATARGLLWIQGEQDAEDATSADDYADNLNKIVCKLRWSSGYEQFVAVIGRQSLSSANSCCYSFPYLTTVRSAQAGLRDSTPCANWLDLDTLATSADSVHLGSLPQLLAGSEAAIAMEACAFSFYDCFPCLMGNLDEGWWIDVQDVVGTINIAFRGAVPPTCPSYSIAPKSDGNCDGVTDVVDVVRVVGIAFRGTPWQPCSPCDCHPYYPVNCPEPCKRFE